MARLNAANNAEATLVQAVRVDDTTFSVDDASVYPPAPFRLTIDDEIVEVTAVVGNELTIERGMEGTAITEHDAGAKARNRFTAGMYDELVGQKEFDTHLAETTQNAHLGKNIGIEDTAGNFTATNVEGALSELFTNVSNGKSLVGGAIADIDDSVVIPIDPSFQQLADAIKGMQTVKIAQGTINGNNSRYLNIRGYNFTPKSIGVFYNDTWEAVRFLDYDKLIGLHKVITMNEGVITLDTGSNSINWDVSKSYTWVVVG